MTDWKELVRQKLAGLALDADAKDEVHAELAAHLQDSYESLRTKGLPEREAAQRALAQVTDWQDLQRQICIAKTGGNLMRKRVQQLWIPGFLVLTGSSIFLMMLQQYRFQPRVVSWGGPHTILLYIPWLLSLPVFGAIGAYLSFRAGGSRKTVLLATVFPVLTYAATIFVILPVSFIVDSHVQNTLSLVGFLRAIFEWMVIPGTALLAGGLPVQFLLSRRSTPRETATSS
jgi:hypothetical protein